VEKEMAATIVAVHAPRVEEVVTVVPEEEAAAAATAEGASVAEPGEKEK
jgi:hypothetical protein